MNVKDSGISWIKLKTNMFDDEKIQLIEQMPEKDSILIIWIRLLIQAGKVNQDGWIFMQKDIPYTAEDLSAIFRRPVNVVRLALETLKRFQMIEMESQGIYITNFPKHQSIEGMEKVRELTRLRVANYRKKRNLLEDKKENKKEDIEECVTSNATVTLHNSFNAYNICKDDDEQRLMKFFLEHFNRRETTPWDENMIKRFHGIDWSDDDLASIRWLKEINHPYKIKTLKTLLNNFPEEVEKANNYKLEKNYGIPKN